MNPNLTAKEMVHNLIANYERLLVENHVLKAMNSEANDPRWRERWELIMNGLIQTSGFREAVHAKFEPLYAEVEQAIEDQAVLAVLLKIPPTNRPN